MLVTKLKMQSSPYGESVISAQTWRLKIIKKKEKKIRKERRKKKHSDFCRVFFFLLLLFHMATCCCCEQVFYSVLSFFKPNWGHGNALNTDFNYVSLQIKNSNNNTEGLGKKKQKIKKTTRGEEWSASVAYFSFRPKWHTDTLNQIHFYSGFV